MKKSAARRKPEPTTEHLAIRSARIQNFRGFTDVALDDIRRVNIVVGQNGAGKTAFLEALFAATLDSPVPILQIRQSRGLPAGAMPTMQESMQTELWEYLLKDLFRDYDTSKPVTISIKGTHGYERTLRIFRGSKPVLLSLNDSAATPKSIPSPISFEWKQGSRKKAITITPELSFQKGSMSLSMSSTPSLAVKGRFLQGIIYPQAEMFSKLKINGAAANFLQEIKQQYPDIEDMSVESEYGNSMIFVRQESHKRRIPINLASYGLSKITAVLLSITSLPGGVLFIDDLENGVYCRRHEKFWQQIAEFCRTYETQFFASVHSVEALNGIFPAMRDSPEDFSLIRVYREDGVSKAAIVQGPVNLLESGIEVRI